jgi:hypothetical protein
MIYSCTPPSVKPHPTHWMRKMNRRQRRAEKRREQRRADLIALTHQALAHLADRDGTITGGTLILPSGETMFIPIEVAQGRGGNA